MGGRVVIWEGRRLTALQVNTGWWNFGIIHETWFTFTKFVMPNVSQKIFPIYRVVWCKDLMGSLFMFIKQYLDTQLLEVYAHKLISTIHFIKSSLALLIWYTARSLCLEIYWSNYLWHCMSNIFLQYSCFILCLILTLLDSQCKKKKKSTFDIGTYFLQPMELSQEPLNQYQACLYKYDCIFYTKSKNDNKYK